MSNITITFKEVDAKLNAIMIAEDARYRKEQDRAALRKRLANYRAFKGELSEEHKLTQKEDQAEQARIDLSSAEELSK